MKKILLKIVCFIYAIFASHKHVDIQYIKLLKKIMRDGNSKGDRTGTGTKSVFGYQMRFDLEKGFPLLSSKKLPIKSIIYELLWFLRGDTNLKYLVDHDVHIWDEWPYKAYLIKNKLPIPKTNSTEWTEGLNMFIKRIKNEPGFSEEYGDLGPVYGYQWRHWPTPDGKFIDQIQNVIDQLKKDPNSRRAIVSAWNVAEIEEMAKSGLPPCHCLYQFYVANGKLYLQLYQRSCDTFLGVPFNIASYALLLMIIARLVGLKYGELIWIGGDTHLYNNHFEQVKSQIRRRYQIRPMPKMFINPNVKNINDFTLEDFNLSRYDPLPSIKAPIAV